MSTLAPPRRGSAQGVAERWEALGTSAVLIVHDGDHERALAAAQREIAAIDRAASRFRADSELTRVNEAHGAWVEISPLLLEAIDLALRAAEISDGAVDPTIGGILVDAGYDRDWHELTPVPAGAPLRDRPRLEATRRRHPAWSAVELGDDPPAVRVPAGVRLDLGATAKALAADRAALAASAASAGGVLIALGGDIAIHGPGPVDGWPVHVTEDHRSGIDAPGQTVSIRSGGLATSSIGVRRWLHDSVPMHHILDPSDGEPVNPVWQTVSVAAATCADANIASTAAIVLGDQAPRWLAQQALPARLVSVDGSVSVQGGWPR